MTAPQDDAALARRLLPPFYLALAAVEAAIALYGITPVVTGIELARTDAMPVATDAVDMRGLAGSYVLFGSALLLLVGGLAAAHVIAATAIATGRSARSVRVVAALTCLFVPLGTALGALTLVTLPPPHRAVEARSARTEPDEPTSATL